MEEEELGAILSSFVFTMLAIKGLNPLADRIGLIDVPNYRKKHEGAVPVYIPRRSSFSAVVYGFELSADEATFSIVGYRRDGGI